MDMNPLRERRLLAHRTQAEEADRYDVSRQLIIRCEQGTYAHIPPALKPNTTLDTAYHSFQANTRLSNYGRLIPHFVFPTTTHPFLAWRRASDLNLTQVCILFCTQQAPLLRFEFARGGPTGGAVRPPVGLLDALLGAGYPPALLESLKAAYRTFRITPLPVGAL